MGPAPNMMMSNVNSDSPAPSGFEPSDGSLLRRIQGGEEEAATQLYLRYAQRLLALAKANTGKDLAARFDPEDVVQSVFRSFFRRASGGCYDVPAGGELWRLLLVLALNKVRGLAVHHRAAKRSVANTVSAHGNDGDIHRAVSADPEPYRVLDMVIGQLLETMPAVQRQMIELRIEGRAVGEIADITKRSKRTVERVLQTFREQLAQLIDTDKDQDE